MFVYGVLPVLLLPRDHVGSFDMVVLCFNTFTTEICWDRASSHVQGVAVGHHYCKFCSLVTMACVVCAY